MKNRIHIPVLLLGVVLVFSYPGAIHSAYAKGGVIVGKVVFKGTPPKPEPVSFGAELQCKNMHKDKPLYKEDIVVNKNGTLKWVLVYLKEGVKGKFTPPNEPVEIDQVGCWFIPHAAAAMVGQKVIFKNSDPVLHNVRGASHVSQNFNVAQPMAGMKSEEVFKKPEIGIQLKCDVHFWMSGFLHVLPHPFFAITKDEGTFKIENVPAGKYVIEAWHEKLGTQTKTIEVKDGQTAEVTFEFEKK